MSPASLCSPGHRDIRPAKGQAIVVPPEGWAGGLAATLLIGALVGLLRAFRATHVSPMLTLWAPVTI